MRRSALCVLVAVLLFLAVVPRPALAQTGLNVEDVVMTRISYNPIRPSEGPVRIYAGDWSLAVFVRNYDVNDGWYDGIKAVDVITKIFVDNVLIDTSSSPYLIYVNGVWNYSDDSGIPVGATAGIATTLAIPEKGSHQIRIEVWHGTETAPQDTYSFDVLTLKAEVSNLQASCEVDRGSGSDLAVSFTNGGNENMRQAVLRIENSSGLTIAPGEVEFGDVNPGENASASFTVSAPSGVRLGTTQIRFSLSFVDYAGIQHEENVPGEVKVSQPSPLSPATFPYWIVLIAVVLAVIAVAIIWRRRSKRKRHEG